jgi:hypothetical protein
VRNPSDPVRFPRPEDSGVAASRHRQSIPHGRSLPSPPWPCHRLLAADCVSPAVPVARCKCAVYQSDPLAICRPINRHHPSFFSSPPPILLQLPSIFLIRAKFVLFLRHPSSLAPPPAPHVLEAEGSKFRVLASLQRTSPSFSYTPPSAGPLSCARISRFPRTKGVLSHAFGSRVA